MKTKRLNQNDADAIRQAHDKDGKSAQSLARTFNVSIGSVRNILRGDTFNPDGEYVPPDKPTLAKALAQVMGKYRKRSCREIAEAIHQRNGRRYAVQSIRNQIHKYFQEKP
jgi:hypothetical protein